MLVLFESAAGYALFKVTDPSKLEKDPENLWKEFENKEKASQLIKLAAFKPFQSAAAALDDISALTESKISPTLKDFISTQLSQSTPGKKGKKSGSATSGLTEELVVAEKGLASSISRVMGIKTISDSSTIELFRGIREQLAELLGAEAGVDEQSLSTMRLGLSHGLGRYRLRFSPDKVDTMIVQAIALLDDLDKELNTYAMRVREWYGWHFPEMGKVVGDNIAYARVVKAMGLRTNAAATDLSEIIPEEIESSLKSVAEISMGTEISEQDLDHIIALADQVISISAYRSQLGSYLRSRMHAIAPNLTALVGELVGARLIAHAGSLMNLAKQPASTVQIYGAEKALFRALKTKHDTPKYGLIYHASLIGQTPQKLKGKMARMLATKTALSVRVDALTEREPVDPASTMTDGDGVQAEDEPDATIGLVNRAKLEARLRQLENRTGLGLPASNSLSSAARKTGRAVNGTGTNGINVKSTPKGYNTANDAVGLESFIRTQPLPGQSSSTPSKAVNGEASAPVELSKEDRKALKKAKKEAKKKAAEEVTDELIKEDIAKAATLVPAAAAATATATATADESKLSKEERKALKKAKKMALAKESASSPVPVPTSTAPATAVNGEGASKKRSLDDGNEKKKKKSKV